MSNDECAKVNFLMLLFPACISPHTSAIVKACAVSPAFHKVQPKLRRSRVHLRRQDTLHQIDLFLGNKIKYINVIRDEIRKNTSLLHRCDLRYFAVVRTHVNE